MKALLWFGVGALVGALVLQPASEGACCRRVGQAVRDEAVDALGGWAGTAGDLLGVWDRAPGLLDFFGVPT